MADIAIVTDEISQDFETAVVLGLEWGIRDFEIRGVYLHRVPDITEQARSALLGTIRQYDVNITAVSPGLFKIPLDSAELGAEMGERFHAACEFARQVGTRKVIVFSFLRPESTQGGAHAYPQQVVDLLGEAARKASQEGVVLCLENEPICWADTGKTTARIVSEVGSESLGINWDPCNAIWSGEARPYPEGYEQVKAHMTHLHVKDARQDQAGEWRTVGLGEGQVDWTGQIAALIRDGFDEYYTVETHFGPGVLTSRACVERLRGIIAEAQGRREDR